MNSIAVIKPFPSTSRLWGTAPQRWPFSEPPRHADCWVRESRRNYSIQVFLGGYLKDDIRVYTRDNCLVISARSTASGRHFFRRVPLGKPVISCADLPFHFECQMLTIAVPKNMADPLFSMQLIRRFFRSRIN